MNNVKRIQQELRRRGLDGMLVTDEKNQRYASGFPITDGAVVVGLEKSWLITDSRYIEAAEAAVDGSLTEVVLYDREHPLTGIIRSVCAGMARLAAEDKKLSHVGYLGYEKALGRELLPAGDLFETLRASKTEEEIACMIEAQRISEKALETVLHIIKPGMTERQVAAELVYNMLKNGDTVIVALSGGADSVALLDNFNSIKEKYNLAFGFVQSFMIVKNIITNAKLPILSEGIKIDETINKAKDRKINLSIFCKTKLFLYKFCVIFCAKEKILFKNIYFVNLNYYSHQHFRLLFHRKLLHLKLSR